ncbi:MAG: MogA/MoaB family molybdenum cofactor biosynthesis protein [Fimbriimonadales bacterium]
MEEKPIGAYRFAVITVSNTRTEETDLSGPAAEEALQAAGAIQIERWIIKDDVGPIQETLSDTASRCDVAFTLGGTGFGPNDITPEATAPLLDRRADSLMELIRTKSFERTPFAHLSRGIAGTIGASLVINLPGSPKGAKDGIEAMLPLLPHILEQIRGGGHD